MTRSAPALTILAALALAACADDSAKAAQRESARRAACVAEELAVRANTNLSALDTLRASGGAAMVEPLYVYSRAYFDYAKLRERQTAWTDSAAARTGEDSARFAARAAQSAPPPPAPNSVQANASTSYEREFNAALANRDHPCNQAEEGTGA